MGIFPFLIASETGSFLWSALKDILFKLSPRLMMGIVASVPGIV